MSSRRMDKRRKQTRLSFTPVPSSSPQRSVAHVRLNDTPTPRKRQRMDYTPPTEEVQKPSSDITQANALSRRGTMRLPVVTLQRNMNQLPTPEASSQLEHSGVAGSKVRRRGVNIVEPVHGAATRSSKGAIHSDSDFELDEEAPLRPSRRRKPTSSEVSSSEDDSDPVTPTAKRTRKGGSFGTAISPGVFSVPKSSRPPNVRSFLAGGTTGNAPVPRSRNQLIPLRQVRNKRRNLEGSDGSDSMSNKEAMSSPDEQRTGSNRRRRRIVIESSDADSDREENDIIAEDARQGRSRTTRKQRKRKQVIETDDDIEPSDDMSTSPIRRQTIKKQPRAQNESDADSMLEELGNEQDQEDLGTRRTGNRQESSARSKRLEGLKRLKQRREGLIELPDDEEEDEDEAEDESTQEEPGVAEDFADKKLDDYDSDFVEDDGDIGVDLMKHGVPLHLTGHAGKKPFDYFKDEIEWMIHNKLDPAFERHDEIYEMAHQKLNDEVLGLAGSEFNSSVWRENFTKSLKTRPEFLTTPVGIDAMEARCGACNRAKHPPKWMITFSGPTYDSKSLEKVTTRDDSDSDSDIESSGSGVEEKEERWHVGSVCCGNAEIAHTLYHWRYQLNATVLQWLSLQGYTTAAKILEREDWSRKKREKLANKVVDGMLTAGEMRVLYQQFKQNLDAARAARAEKVTR